MKNLILTVLLASTLVSPAFAESTKIASISARVDTDSFNQLNELALKMFPFMLQFEGQTKQDGIQYLDSQALDKEFESRKNIPQFQEDYKKLYTNVEMLLVSKGIVFTQLPQNSEYLGYLQQSQPVIKPNPDLALSPLLERVVFSIVQKNADTFFSSAKSSNYFFAKAMVMSAIPVVNVLYMLARGSGSYNKDLQEQGRRFTVMEVCSLKDVADDEWIQHYPLTENECDAIGSEVLKSFKLMLTGLYSTALLIQKHQQAYGTAQQSFALGAPVFNYMMSDLLQKVRETQIGGGWINLLMREIMLNSIR